MLKINGNYLIALEMTQFTHFYKFNPILGKNLHWW